MAIYSVYLPYTNLSAFVKTATHRAQYSCEEFKRRLHVRLRQLEAHADAPAYAPVLAALRQNVQALQGQGITRAVQA